MTSRRDDLDDFIADRTRANPDFPAMVEDALARRQLLRSLAEQRQAEGLTRTTVAARMGTSESAVARLEGGESDAKLSTVGRYAAALGKRIEWRIVGKRPTRRAG
jgi:DNA-binding XRE family transcriptional regulator